MTGLPWSRTRCLFARRSTTSFFQMVCNIIVEGELDAGCKVPCARFGASRTPHREVLNMLSVKGWQLPENHRAGRRASIGCDGSPHSSGERTGLNRPTRPLQTASLATFSGDALT